MKQDPKKWGKPCYDWIEPKILNFVCALITGVSGGFTQGSYQSIDVWDCPEGIRVFRKILFGKV